MTNRYKKQTLRKDMQHSGNGQPSAYKALRTIARWMDNFFLDPLLGLILPGGTGDFLTSLLMLPYIYVAACKIRSVPLTLAVIFNILRDIALGLIPFFIGDLLDFANRSFVQNTRLIISFVENDRQIIEEVNRKAFWTGTLAVILCIIIFLLASLAVRIAGWTKDLIGTIF